MTKKRGGCSGGGGDGDDKFDVDIPAIDGSGSTFTNDGNVYNGGTDNPGGGSSDSDNSPDSNYDVDISGETYHNF